MTPRKPKKKKQRKKRNFVVVPTKISISLIINQSNKVGLHD